MKKYAGVSLNATIKHSLVKNNLNLLVIKYDCVGYVLNNREVHRTISIIYDGALLQSFIVFIERQALRA